MPSSLAIERTQTATLDAVAHCAEFVRAQTRQAGYSTARSYEIELVVEEIVTNICRYSYGERIGHVELCCRRIDGAQLELEFIDGGCPFDILSLPEPDLSVGIDQRDVGGIGAQMLRVLADRASYRFADGRNVLNLVFYPACRLSGASAAPCEK
jgi:anti-sigma regulatory factor (Ser/Thr protein kinase)